MSVTSKELLKDYCMRRLGFPVIEVNVDDDQVEDRINDAFQFYFDYHYDGVEKVYYAHQLTADNLTTRYVEVPDSLIAVTRVLPFGGDGALSLFAPMNDPALAFDTTMMSPFGSSIGSRGSYVAGPMLDQAGGAGGSGSMGSMLGNYILNTNMKDTIQQIFAAEAPLRFNRHTNRVYIDYNLSEMLSEGDYVVLEGWATLDPDVYTDVYNDRWLKRYATALIKRQWGTNLYKYSGIQLPGGVTLDGDKLYEQAEQEIEKLEEEMQLKYEEPPMPLMG